MSLRVVKSKATLFSGSVIAVPCLKRDFVPPQFEGDEALAWIWEAFRDDHPGRLYEMYATETWERVKEDLYDELMEWCREQEVGYGTRH